MNINYVINKNYIKMEFYFDWMSILSDIFQ